ncbi:glycoside hydrolase family 88/105 protein [Sunxiuqinia indica]|uniref:glycoside hydrolase family 88/105 protein n=1 Tax=Sunxiuqinia indica TaxID=2692584 RepID=UPI00135A306B|nr:glycoside hydrolase family 88 protein [Sunxiuqinia indica]
MKKMDRLTLMASFVLPFLLGACTNQTEQTQKTEPATDTTTPLHLLQPDYPTPYGAPTIDEVTKVIDRVYTYLDESTPAKVIDGETKEEVSDFTSLPEEAVFVQGDFRLTSYEWGVTYAGMLLATEMTGDSRYADYTKERLGLINKLANYYWSLGDVDAETHSLIHSVLHPGALDDAGAICAAMIKTERLETMESLRPMIDNFAEYIHNKQFRLPDGTLARNRPQPNTLWLDDLFMSVPALAQMGKLTGDSKYYDDAVKQVLQFSERMFNAEKGLYMHGWVQHMDIHPQFHWARANGWAVMTLVELLDVLPENHEGFDAVLEQLQAHIKGLSKYQHGTGFWHQLIDRNDTYLETSATAIYTYSIAKAINRGWIDKYAYAPVAMLGWNAVTTMVNDKGQVEGTCVGTGMGFDPAFYYYRPINVYAAHGYGPVLLAGAEVINLLKSHAFEINDSSLQMIKE